MKMKCLLLVFTIFCFTKTYSQIAKTEKWHSKPNQPLFIIDSVKINGRFTPFTAIHPDEIKEIKVIGNKSNEKKQYGEAGKYGVLIITTYNPEKHSFLTLRQIAEQNLSKPNLTQPILFSINGVEIFDTTNVKLNKKLIDQVRVSRHVAKKSEPYSIVDIGLKNQFNSNQNIILR